MKQRGVTEPDPAGKATVRDVAEETGVSVATVSRVLNGRGSVAPHTRRLVHEAVERLGSRAPTPRQPSAAARTAGTVLIRCPYLLTDYFGIIVSAVAETLALHGRQALLDAGHGAIHSEIVHSLPRRRDLAAAVLILPPEPVAELEWLRAHGFPFVVVDPRVPPPRDTLAVSAAHFSGARAVTAHLIGLGHRRIGIIAGTPYSLASDSRVSGHATALAEVGVLADPSLMRRGEPDTDTGVRAGGELLDLTDRPTAIVGFNDKIAVGVMQAAAERGLGIPADLSVVGFDDLDLSRATTPQLTTVRQPIDELGRMAVALLVRVLDGHQTEALHVELATELIVRGTTAPPRRW
jgi:LacI family transcriptional regulator